jgi:hypothetical protein
VQLTHYGSHGVHGDGDAAVDVELGDARVAAVGVWRGEALAARSHLFVGGDWEREIVGG